MRKISIRFLWVPLVLIATTAAAQQKGWESQWKEILAGAKKEGKVVVMGSADPVVRTKLPAAFKKRFGISLEYLGGRGSENTARILTEARVGVQTIDAVFSGLSSQASLYKAKVSQPIKPLLDAYKWKFYLTEVPKVRRLMRELLRSRYAWPLTRYIGYPIGP